MLTLESLSNDEMVERINRIATLHDDVSVSPEIAGLFLARSPRSLERLRSEGAGPPYVQDKHGNSTARNHAVTYRMGDLRAWRDARLLNNPREAAVRNRKGLSFGTLADFTDEQPWFVAHNAESGAEATLVILAHAAVLSPDVFEASLIDESLDVVWLSAETVLGLPWDSADSREPFHDALTEVLESTLRRSFQLQESMALQKTSVEAAVVPLAPVTNGGRLRM